MKHLRQFHSNAVWPPAAFVVVFCLIYGTLQIAFWLIERSFPGATEHISELPEIINLRRVIIGIASGCYAVFRLVRFHPACNQAYMTWLRSSPWTAAKPLPLGPVHIVWQDAVVFGVLAAVAKWHARANPALPVIVFGFIYLGGFTLLLAYTRRWTHCALLGFLWPAFMLPIVKGPLAIFVVLAIIAVIWHGHWTSLRAFPWKFLQSSDLRSGKSVWQTEVRVFRRASDAGWPFVALSTNPSTISISRSTSLVLSLLVGWWLYCLFLAMDTEASPVIILPWAIFAAFFRVLIYCVGISPPFTLWGRIVSGRIIVPRFDQIFLTPLIVVLLAIIGAALIRRFTFYPAVTVSLFASMLVFVLLSGGPTLRTWTLTGQHRLRPPRVTNSKQILKPI